MENRDLKQIEKEKKNINFFYKYFDRNRWYTCSLLMDLHPGLRKLNLSQMLIRGYEDGYLERLSVKKVLFSKSSYYKRTRWAYQIKENLMEEAMQLKLKI